MQGRHSSGATSPSSGCQASPITGAGRACEGKTFLPGKIPCLQPLKIIPPELCAIALSSLRLDFELAEPSLVLHRLCLQDPHPHPHPFSLNDEDVVLRFFVERWGGRTRAPRPPLSVFLATSSDGRLRRSPEGQLALWFHAALCLPVSC